MLWCPRLMVPRAWNGSKRTPPKRKRPLDFPSHRYPSDVWAIAETSPGPPSLRVHAVWWNWRRARSRSSALALVHARRAAKVIDSKTAGDDLDFNAAPTLAHAVWCRITRKCEGATASNRV